MEPVWLIQPEHQHQAAFYRNTLIHAFLETSIIQLALAHTARSDGGKLEAFWNQVARLRDLLKFDFYFPDSASFTDHVTEEMTWLHNWEQRIACGGDMTRELLRDKHPLMAATMLRPYFEAYSIVADVLHHLPDEPFDNTDLIQRALGLGRQYVAQRVRSNESVSTLLFATARQVVADQGLLTTPSADLRERRAAFQSELRGILVDLDTVERLATTGALTLFN
jgi:glycerol-3-phosphate O-acyltransferase